MRRCLWLVLVVACSDKQAPIEKQHAPVASDPWKQPAGPSIAPPPVADPEAMRQAMRDFNGDLMVVKEEDFADYRAVLAAVEQVPDVATAEPYEWAQVKIASTAWPRWIRVKGVDPKRIGAEKSLGAAIVTGTISTFDRDEQPPPILLGSTLADKLGVAVGDVVRLRAPSDDVPQPFRVAATFRTKYDVYDSGAAIVPMPALQDVVGDGDSVRAIGVWVANDKAATVADVIRKTVGGSPYVVVDVNDLTGNPFMAGLEASLANP